MDTAKYISEIHFDNSIGNHSYLNNLPIIKYLSMVRKLRFSSNVTFFVGENGTGKSTLLEAIAVAFGFNAEGGTKNFSFSTNKTHSELWEHLTLVKKTMPRTDFSCGRRACIMPLHILTRLMLPTITVTLPYTINPTGKAFYPSCKTVFSGKGLYILDEPEAALSPMKLLTLMAEMDTLVKDDSQFIIATHSPILMAFPNAELWEFSQDGIQKVQYRDTEHYQVTKSFLDNPERMLHYLLSSQ